MGNNTITLRSWAGKMKTYYLQPCKQPNGTNYPFVKPVRRNPDGSSEMVLTDAERNSPESQFFIREDEVIEVMDGTTFDLDNPLERNKWLAIRNSDIIVPTRDAKDKNGNYLIDGDKNRYGIAELWIYVPGQDSEKIVEKKKLINQAWTYIENDSVDGRLTKCKLLGKNMRNMPTPDVEAYLYEIAEKTPKQIIDLYTNGDTALKLMFIDAIDKGIISKKAGLYSFGDTIIGSTEDTVIYFLKLPTNKNILDLIKNQTYPEFVPKVVQTAVVDNVVESGKSELERQTLTPEEVDKLTEVKVPTKTATKKTK